MRDIKKKVYSLRKVYKYLLVVILVAALFWTIPSVLIGNSFLGGSQRVSASTDPVIAAAGDIACDPASTAFNGGNGTSVCRQKYTAALMINTGLSAVLPLGDNQYNCGGYTAYLESYALSWGKLLSISHPVTGNHEYLTSGGTDCSTSASGYFKYYGAAAGPSGKGYYSYNIGSWHIIALNSQCSQVGGCSSGSPQYTWLQNDLAANSAKCTLAYWHIPLFSSGSLSSTAVRSLWTLLYNANADVILNGHDHMYECFAPQNPSGGADSTRGIREFVVGTGGSNHQSISAIAANSQVINTSTYGVLKLTLHSTSYSWQFVPISGETFTDSGTASCH